MNGWCGGSDCPRLIDLAREPEAGSPADANPEQAKGKNRDAAKAGNAARSAVQPQLKALATEVMQALGGRQAGGIPSCEIVASGRSAANFQAVIQADANPAYGDINLWRVTKQGDDFRQG